MEISGVSSSATGYLAQAMRSRSGKRPEMTSEMAGKIAEDLVSKKDADSSGGLSVSETGLSEDAFSSVDTDGDGIVSSDELKTGLTSKNEALKDMMPPPRPMGTALGQGQGMGMPEDMAQEISASLLDDKDADGSGDLSLEETGLSEDDFSSVDADGDGIVTSDELTAGLSSMNEALKGMMPEPPAGMPPGGGMASGDGEDSSSSFSNRYAAQAAAAYQSTQDLSWWDTTATGSEYLNTAA